MLIITPSLYLMNLPGCRKAYKKTKEKSKGDQCMLTQKEANFLCEATQVDTANNMSNYMNYIMTCIFFSPIVPLAMPAALVGSFVFYWAFKYRLLRTHAMPNMFSRALTISFANWLPAIPFIWALSLLTILRKVSAPRSDNAVSRDSMPRSDNAVIMALIGLAAATLYILCPFGVVIKKWAN